MLAAKLGKLRSGNLETYQARVRFLSRSRRNSRS